MRRAAAAVPEVILLLRQMPAVQGPERQPDASAARIDWRRACLQYEGEVLRTYAKRCHSCSLYESAVTEFRPTNLPPSGDAMHGWRSCTSLTVASCKLGR